MRLRILDFDIECLPGHWIGGDYVSKIITAVAWRWHDERDVMYRTHYDTDSATMATILRDKVVQAGLVTGHYIRGFDLPLLNGALLAAGEPPLPKLTTVDTKLDLKKAHGRSLSQKNLAALIGVSHPKIELTLSQWEGFNLRVPECEEPGVERVTGDVRQHTEMYSKLVDMGWIAVPKTWSPESKGSSYRG